MTDDVIVTTSPEAYEQKTSGQSVTHAHVIVDSDGDKEAVTLDPRAGASSEAPAGSGIPSAERQHRVGGEVTAKKDETSMADHIQPMRQNIRP